jgi:hypothetical protein
MKILLAIVTASSSEIDLWIGGGGGVGGRGGGGRGGEGEVGKS